jgi:hypothetical protein
MAVEAKRGCGYRKAGGLYLVGGGLSAPCDRMPYPLERCRTCGGGIKFTRGPQWLQPDFFTPHHDVTVGTKPTLADCSDDSACPVCRNRDDFGPHLLLWIGRKHYTPEAYLEEGRRLGVSRRLSAMPKGLVLGETWVLLAHLDAVPPKEPQRCTVCNMSDKLHLPGAPADVCSSFQAPKPTPGIFCAFIPRAVELILKQSDATPERIEKEAKRGVTVIAVPDDDKDHQGSVWDKDDEESQPELPRVSP